jgi:hypothetical protein
VLAAEPAAARARADPAILLARASRIPAVLADALELAAMTGPPATADPLLADAARIWADIGDPVAEARVAYARACTGRAPAAWQSRKVRDLLELLICRRGRPISREDDPLACTTNRHAARSWRITPAP